LHVVEVVLSPLQLLPVTIAGILYVLRVDRLRGTPRAVPAARQASFLGGLALIAATLTLTGGLSDELFAAHMAEHLLLADLGALALVLGLTGPTVAPLLRVRAIDRLRALAHPVPAFALWAVDLALWHVATLHEAAVRHEAVHALQHTAFIVFGANMWMALLGPLPKPPWFGNLARLVYVIAVRMVGAVLANVFVFGGRVFYDVYAAGERAHGISPAADQNAAGAIMMIEGSLLTIALFAWLFLRSAREGEERQALLARAARAVAAGRGPELRRRIESG
jgi:putative membrane protein